MGGWGYDRDVYESTSASSSSGFDYSRRAAEVFTNTLASARSASSSPGDSSSACAQRSDSARPKSYANLVSPFERRLTCTYSSAVVACLDVTGST